MAYYFDVNDSNHTDKINRWNADIVSNVTESLAKEAEDDVVDYYSIQKNLSTYIYLAEYKEDGLDETEDADFLDAFRTAVAHQIWWLYTKQTERAWLYKSRRKGKESISFDKSVLNRRYPPGFKKHLRKYDRLPVV